ncbi:MAG: F0F1 ATP synthase subunit delta [Spirochaetia bacterium]|jgi:hypothetical protein|nr:F0F1 ATP synthase subunit delta [Spirochaetia bacterium]
MFGAGRWARAFLDACADKTEEGLAALEALEACFPAASWGSGGGASARLGRTLLGARGRVFEANAGTAAACRTLMLLVKRGLAGRLSEVAGEARRIWDAENGVLAVVLESAFPLDGEFIETLRRAVQEKTAARLVHVSARLAPHLIGGCRLRVGTQCLDASVSGQLRKMAADLHAAGGFSW